VDQPPLRPFQRDPDGRMSISLIWIALTDSALPELFALVIWATRTDSDFFVRRSYG